MTLSGTTAATAAIEDPFPEPGLELCAIGLEFPPGEPAELPVIEDPVSGTTDAIGCVPDFIDDAPSAFDVRQDAKATLATVDTDFGFLPNGQIRINAYNLAKNAMRDSPSTGTVKYEVTVTFTPQIPPNSPPKTATRVVDVSIVLPQNDGSVGGTNTTNFAAADVPVGATATVKVISGSVNILVGKGPLNPGNPGVAVPSDVEAKTIGEKKR